MGRPRPGSRLVRATSSVPGRASVTTRGASGSGTRARPCGRPPGASHRAPGGGGVRPTESAVALRRPLGTCLTRAAARAAATRSCACCLLGWPWSCAMGGSGGRPKVWRRLGMGRGSGVWGRCGVLACCGGCGGKSLPMIGSDAMSLWITTYMRGLTRLASFSTTEACPPMRLSRSAATGYI